MFWISIATVHGELDELVAAQRNKGDPVCHRVAHALSALLIIEIRTVIMQSS